MLTFDEQRFKMANEVNLIQLAEKYLASSRFQQ